MFQHHYIVQALLAVTLIALTISVATPDWEKTGDTHGGLWQTCGKQNKKVKCGSLHDLGKEKGQINTVRILSIIGAACAFLGLMCSLFAPNKWWTIGFAFLTVGTSVASLTVYATEVKAKMDKRPYINIDDNKTLSKYGFSFYLQMVGAILAVIAMVIPFRPGYVHKVITVPGTMPSGIPAMRSSPDMRSSPAMGSMNLGM